MTIRLAGRAYAARGRVILHLHRRGRGLKRRLRKKYGVGEFSYSTFMVAFALDQKAWPPFDSDEFLDRYCLLLNEIERAMGNRDGTEAGCGGGGDGSGVCELVFQRNRVRSGKLAPCTEDDRDVAGGVLMATPGVLGVVVGPLDKGPETGAMFDERRAAMLAELAGIVGQSQGGGES